MQTYESMVGLAARALSERDSHPMPVSVTTTEAFYKVMARAALDAIDLQSLLQRIVETERDQRMIEESLRRIEETLRDGDSMLSAAMPAPDARREEAVPGTNLPPFELAGARAARTLGWQPRAASWKRRLLP